MTLPVRIGLLGEVGDLHCLPEVGGHRSTQKRSHLINFILSTPSSSVHIDSIYFSRIALLQCFSTGGSVEHLPCPDPTPGLETHVAVTPGGVAGIQRGSSRDAVKMHRAAPHNKELSRPKHQ